MSMRGGFRNPLTTSATLADGAVTEAKLGALAVTTAKIANAAITSAKIDDLAVTNAKIANATITGAKIANATIDTAQIANAAITNAKISDLSATKITTGTISAETVSLGTGGVIRSSTSASGDRIEIGGDHSDEIRWYWTSTAHFSMQVIDTALTLDASANGDFLIGDGISSSVNTYINVRTLGQLICNGTVQLEWNSTRVTIEQASLQFGPSTSDRLDFDTGLNQFQMIINGTSEFVLGTGGVLIPNVYNSTTASAANVQVDSAGTLRRSTSSRRYKRRIRDWSEDLVGSLRPRSFESRLDGREFLGLIAEEVDDVLPVAVVRDVLGRPDALDWAVLTTALIASHQKLEARVRELERLQSAA